MTKKFNFKKEDYVLSNLTQVRKYALEEVPADIASGKIASFSDYLTARRTLNLSLIQLLTGSKLVDHPKKGNTLKFDQKLPTTEQVARIASMVQDYIDSVETPYLASVSEDDISIPPYDFDLGIDTADISKKEFLDRVFGNNGSNMFLNNFINAADVVTIASAGLEIRRKRNSMYRMIVYGSIVAITGGAIAYCLIKNYKDKDDSDDDIIDTTAEDIDDVPDIEDDEEVPETEDVPVVEME